MPIFDCWNIVFATFEIFLYKKTAHPDGIRTHDLYITHRDVLRSQNYGNETFSKSWFEILGIVWMLCISVLWKMHCQASSISRTKSQSLNVSCLVLQLSFPNPTKPVVKSRMKMQLEQRRQAMLQLHLSDQPFYCLLRYDLYWSFDGVLTNELYILIEWYVMNLWMNAERGGVKWCMRLSLAQVKSMLLYFFLCLVVCVWFLIVQIYYDFNIRVSLKSYCLVSQNHP